MGTAARAAAPAAALSAEQRAARVTLMILDVDGVLTDGRLYYGAQGEALKAFAVRDGHGLKLLQAAGIEVAILTARRSEIVAVRMKELGIARVLQGAADKLAGFEQLRAAAAVPAERCGYVGDDWPDLPVLARVGFAATVADACDEAKSRSHWIAASAGGRGAVRQLAEFVLRAQGRFDALLAKHTEGVLHA
jgi:3-deoxy-D-manno-octulosonate 8-phosphate phosphatase (KDO 8-P phosphatase)